MENILFLSHSEPDGSLDKACFETLTAAQKLVSDTGGQLIVGLFGQSVDEAVNAIGGCGAARFIAVSGDEFAQARYATDAAAVEALAKACEASFVIAPSTPRMNRIIAGVAQRLGGVAETEVTDFAVADDKVSVTRWFYRQRIMGSLTRSKRPWVMTVSSGCFDAADCQAAATVEVISVDVPESRTTVQLLETSDESNQTIRPDADLLFVAGAGWTKPQAGGDVKFKDAEDLILGFLNKSQASLGGSKSVVDLGSEGQESISFMNHLHQIGQTGSTPRHPKGLSTCCHGEEPHAVGWRFVNERRAVNTDANCAWTQGKADVVYIADAFEVMQKVNALIG